MSLANEEYSTQEQPAQEQPAETNLESKKKQYTRDVLLSFSELDECKKLPSDFPQSILSECDLFTIHDRPRSSGNSLLQSSRRIEYSSSPPTRGDSYRPHGKWDSRSGWNDKDSDSQSDRDADSGRRYNNQSWRASQTSEHDGLLGSGSFPRPPGYTAGASGPKPQTTDQYQLSRSNEPYHPPRPYKAVPHSRSGHDSLNDETFGSTEVTSQDREEEERKRRASFELMRKEQHKAFQEKQKLNQDKHSKDSDSDTNIVLEDSKDDQKLVNRNSKPDDSVVPPTLYSDSGKSALSSQTHTSRPLVPPGFTGTTDTRSFGTKSLLHTLQPEVENTEPEDILLLAKIKPQLEGTSDNKAGRQSTQNVGLKQLHDTGSTRVPLTNKIENNVNSSSDVKFFNDSTDTNKLAYKPSILLEGPEALEDGEIIELDAGRVTSHKVKGESNPAHSTSILDKIFGGALAGNSGATSSFIEDCDVKEDEIWNPNTVQSSKFARWFRDEEKVPANDLPSGRPSGLLSLIVGVGNSSAQVSHLKATEHTMPVFPLESSEQVQSHTKSNISPVTAGIAERSHNTNEQEAFPAVITCEDLEQSILSEITDNSLILLQSTKKLNGFDSKTEQPITNIDDRASQHLLSLLHKGDGLKDTVPSSKLPIGSSNKLASVEARSVGNATSISAERNEEKVGISGRSLTLETLFGTAFMAELQSVGAPVSVQRGENLRPQTSSDNIEEHVVGFNDPRMKMDSSRPSGFEEDNLISVGNPVDARNMFTPGGNPNNAELLSSNSSATIAEKLAALNARFKDEGSNFFRDRYDRGGDSDIPYQNFHMQQPSTQLRPSFHGFDSHPTNINSQMKFAGSESIIHRELLPYHQFPANILRPSFQRTGTGPTGFDPPAHHPMLQQMHALGNFPPPHLLRGGPLPSHPNNHSTGFIQEPNQMQGFPFGPRQSNFGGHGMHLPGGDGSSGSNHPEALQRIMEMEKLRSNQKQIHPFAAAGHSQGMYGNELDTGFRYR